MRYSNPPLPAIEPPADERREFLTLFAAVGVILALLIGGTALLASRVAPYIPFSAESALAGSMVHRLGGTVEAKDAPRQAALEALTAKLVKAMDLPGGMTITVHYVDKPVVNAAATLGGHLFVYRGLLEKLHSEDELSAVIAHEIGHVRERHVIAAMGRGVAVLVALRAVGVKSQALTEWLTGEGAQLTMLSFSRDAERAADLHALDAVEKVYGHVGGVMDLFALFEKLGSSGVELAQSHPLPEHRYTELKETAARLGYQLDGDRKPLPEALRSGS